ncbi:MAG TPA: glycosyl transferase, partial [Clostridiales bacterium]|nr:glycosyl transferase [Clostridiales bacterium]
MNPLISVIVPVYRVEAFLPRCLDSIRGQTYKNLEIILVDDGSPDNCGKICDEYAEMDSRIRVIHKKNGGLSSARNAGLDVAVGDYIGFVDSDDWIAPEMYETLLGAI